MKVIHADDKATFDTEAAHGVVMVDFFAERCGPCKIIAPFVEQLAEEYAGKAKIIKVNVDENPDTAAEFEVISIPTLFFLKDGKVVDQVVGALPKIAMAERLDALLNAPAAAEHKMAA